MSRCATLLLWLAVSLVAAVDAGKDPFLVKPYLQLGRNPRIGLALLWHTADRDANFAVQTRTTGAWSASQPAVSRRISVSGIEPHRVWSVALSAPKPGSRFAYRVQLDGAVVFEGETLQRPGRGTPHRFAVFGDCGQNTPAQRQIAYRVFQTKPDFLFITGDIVYSRGRISEYREKYFPIYGAAQASPETGAPLLASTLFAASPGNHDIAEKDFEKYPDTQAYYYYWQQPLNGPLGEPGAFTSKTEGAAPFVDAFRKAAGADYPRMANFSFDYGNAHWTVLDANPYTDWTKPELRDWLIADLRAASRAQWRFVGFHHPGFNSSKAHFSEQRMRVLAPVFETLGVDIVFAGHVHNYQRTFPMLYDPFTSKWTLDRDYDGANRTKPKGVIYLVTGAGGAKLYNPEQQDDRASMQEFTHVFLSKINSFTLVETERRKLTVRQIDVDGKEIDRFMVTR
ncbi:MAG: metallophosphoesterase [Bryobacteraceae bacterium]